MNYMMRLLLPSHVSCMLCDLCEKDKILMKFQPVTRNVVINYVWLSYCVVHLIMYSYVLLVIVHTMKVVKLLCSHCVQFM
jgi:hypothetical protein